MRMVVEPNGGRQDERMNCRSIAQGQREWRRRSGNIEAPFFLGTRMNMWLKTECCPGIIETSLCMEEYGLVEEYK